VTTRRHVAVLAPMQAELKAVVDAFGLRPGSSAGVCTHTGTVGDWSVGSLVTGIGPSNAAAAARRVLGEGPHHVMVVGIAGALDPALGVGALLVPARVRLHPDGPEYESHPLPPRRAEGALMTTDGLFDAEDVWRPMLEAGFGAVDMEAAGVAQVCEEAGVPWSVYRGISDRPDEHIVDQAIFALSKPDGSPDTVAVAKYLARHPRRARALSHLNRCMKVAAAAAAGAAAADLRRC